LRVITTSLSGRLYVRARTSADGVTRAGSYVADKDSFKLWSEVAACTDRDCGVEVRGANLDTGVAGAVDGAEPERNIPAGRGVFGAVRAVVPDDATPLQRGVLTARQTQHHAHCRRQCVEDVMDKVGLSILLAVRRAKQAELLVVGSPLAVR